MRRAKISVIGGGNVGASCALWAASKELGDVIVLDIPDAEGMVKGKMLDLAQCAPVERFDSNIVGTADYADTADSDVVIVTLTEDSRRALKHGQQVFRLREHLPRAIDHLADAGALVIGLDFWLEDLTSKVGPRRGARGGRSGGGGYAPSGGERPKTLAELLDEARAELDTERPKPAAPPPPPRGFASREAMSRA